MSTFGGRFTEFPGISVDRFDGENVNSDAFFLSHCHMDHMVGLDSPKFQKNLIETSRFIYLSHVSAEILKNTYPELASNLKELDLHSPTLVKLNNSTIAVTPIPAGHCPGSIMFLFEGGSTVLYTGDYRINPSDISKFKAFYDSFNIKKRIDAVYLDTTFFLKSYEKFPLRGESLNEICSIIKNWISRSEKHVIALKTSAKYGYEYLFIEIYKQLKMPIHVNEEVFEFYSRVPELDTAVTRCNAQTKIHSACGSTYLDICKNSVSFRVKTIKVSAFRWRSDNLQNGISENCHDIHFVCYSTHASYEEGVALLKFLKPKKVEANVLHSSSATNDEIYKNIEENLEEPGPEVKKVKLFHVVQSGAAKVEERRQDLGEFDSILDSPPRHSY